MAAKNSKLHNKFKEINTKNAFFLDSDSNAIIICNKNYAEHMWDANSIIPVEMNSSLTPA